jgi:excisionase family DNA binding protein
MGEVLNVSVVEAARRLGVCARTVANLIQAKELNSRRIGRRRVIPVADLERFNRRDHPTANRAEPHRPKERA